MRQAAGKTLPELAEVLNYDKGNLSRLERGKARAPAPLAAEWAEACGYRMRFISASATEEEEMLGHLDLVDREVVKRLSRVLPNLEPSHRATLIHLLDLWERST